MQGWQEIQHESTQPPFEQEISSLISKGSGCHVVSPPFLRSAISLWLKLHRFCCLHQHTAYREKWIVRSVWGLGGWKHRRIFHDGKVLTPPLHPKEGTGKMEAIADSDPSSRDFLLKIVISKPELVGISPSRTPLLALMWRDVVATLLTSG